jgi:DNA-binding NarL/FixJ family response regulator
VFSPQVAARLGSWFSSLGSIEGRTAFPQLTDREREILDLMARGLDNRHIARELTLSEKTVRNHVSNVMGKIDADSRAVAVLRARNAGLGG